jgi:tripartite-type tricarboxylate transporter receptor subunit TctC
MTRDWTLPASRQRVFGVWPLAPVLALLALALMQLSPTSLAQTASTPAPTAAVAWPVRPLTIVVPLAAGGGYDFLGRLLAEGLGRELSQTVIVENRPGAGSVIGTQHVVRSQPDGYTLVVGGIGSIAHAPALIKDLPYNPATDLVPLQLLSTNAYTLTSRNDLGLRSLAELLAYARANPGRLTIGTPGQGTGQGVATALLKSLGGVDLLEVQYKGASPVYVDMMAGRVDLFFDATGTALPFIRGGKIRALATSAHEREAIAPELPTARESGLSELSLENWSGLFAPAQTPRAVVLRLREALNRIAQQPDFRRQMNARGYNLVSPPDVEAFVRAELQRWPVLLRRAGLRPQ